MDTNSHTPRVHESASTCAENGRVVWSYKKSLWYLTHVLLAIVGGWLTFSFSAVLVFVSFTAITLCFGHSLGMHRRLIHNSYECSKWMEYIFVHLGVLVGMAGPFGMIQQHDLRDWAQRKTRCHSYLRHGENFWKDGWWQLNCELQLCAPPQFRPELRIKHDPVYRFMENTWMLQQLPWALVLYYFGGFAWVIWGISARIAVSVTGHWLIGYFAHNQGGRDWYVRGAAVQGHNVPFVSLLTMGESWHNNHHAYPGSAMLGLYEGQSDPGWWVLNRLINIGLVWNVKLPKDLVNRPELEPVSDACMSNKQFKKPQPCPIMGMLT